MSDHGVCTYIIGYNYQGHYVHAEDLSVLNHYVCE